MCLPGLQRLDDLKQVTHRAGQPVEAHHDQDLTRPDLAEEPRQHRSGPAGTGSVLPVDLGTASGAQLIELSIVRLILSGNTSVADQASFREGRGHHLRWLSEVCGKPQSRSCLTQSPIPGPEHGTKQRFGGWATDGDFVRD
jgi:hypothetical protein